LADHATGVPRRERQPHRQARPTEAAAQGNLPRPFRARIPAL